MAEIRIRADQPGERIDPNVYGHFSEHLGHCIYGGLWVGEESPIPNTRGIRDDVVAALREMGIPNMRWPGGCFADEYHWMDGIGPREKRKRMVNTHWGGVVEDNAFGTHEFLDLCGQLGCEPYISGNLGSGTVREMQEWVEYMTFTGESPMADLRRANGREEPWRVRLFGVGNENWGCGGNMRPEYYADEFRRYATYVRDFGDNKVFRIACGASEDDVRWTEVLMREAARMMQGLSLHKYTIPSGAWDAKGSATDFGRDEWFAVMAGSVRMEDLIAKHAAVMDRFDPRKRVALVVDEWGTWYDVEPGTNPGFLYQQNTIRDALVAGIHLNVFNRRCDRVRVANLAQVANVLQSVVLTDGPKLVRTPTYHVFRLYKVHQGGRLLPSETDCGATGTAGFPVPALHASASVDPAGVVHVTVCNLDPERAEETRLSLAGTEAAPTGAWTVRADAMSGRNTFEDPDRVRIEAFDGWKPAPGGAAAVLPPMSVTRLDFALRA